MGSDVGVVPPEKADAPREKTPGRGVRQAPGVESPDEWIIPQVEAVSSGWSSTPSPFTRAESPNRKSLRPGNRGFPGNGLLVDAAWSDVRGTVWTDTPVATHPRPAPIRGLLTTGSRLPEVGMPMTACGSQPSASVLWSRALIPATPYASPSPRRPGPQATQLTEDSYKAWASQARTVAYVAATAERSHGMRCL